MSGCNHELWERESSVETEGFCPICMALKLERMRIALKPFAELGRQLNASGLAAWPDESSMRYLRMEGIRAKHFRAAAAAIE